jgi:hypothetical protein
MDQVVSTFNLVVQDHQQLTHLCSQGCSRQFQIAEVVLKEHAGGANEVIFAASDTEEPVEEMHSPALYVCFFCSGIMDDDL